MTMETKKKVSNFFKYLILILVGCIMLYPLV